MSIHAAAAAVCLAIDSSDVLNDRFQSLLDLARAYRDCQYYKALGCRDELGGSISNDPLIVEELRSHKHDILNPNRD